MLEILSPSAGLGYGAPLLRRPESPRFRHEAFNELTCHHAGRRQHESYIFATICALRSRRAAKLGGEQDDGVLDQPAPLQNGESK